MADEAVDNITRDLQERIRNADINLTNVSTIAKRGDEKLVEEFLSESIFLRSSGGQKPTSPESHSDVLASQLYIACFWGFRDIVKSIMGIAKDQDIDLNVNAQNKNTLWTPLHAAAFQEHGPIVMLLLENGADPNLQDSQGRSPKDFASASDKVWGHLAMIGLQRTPRSDLVSLGIIIQQCAESSPSPSAGVSPRAPGQGIQMASYHQNDPSTGAGRDMFLQAASLGDVLANDEEEVTQVNAQPQFSVYK